MVLVKFTNKKGYTWKQNFRSYAEAESYAKGIKAKLNFTKQPKRKIGLNLVGLSGRTIRM